MNFKVKEIIDFIKTELEHKNITFKENDRNLIIECPICKYRDGKPNKIKLYISKEENKPLIFHCFRCGTKGTIFKLSKILKQYYKIDISRKFDIFEFVELNKNTINSKSYKGVNGGFTLNKLPSEINMLAIMTCVEGKAPAVFECSPSQEDCPSNRANICSLWPFLNKLQGKIDLFLERLTLADLLND